MTPLSELPAHLDLTVGEKRSFELPGLGTAGYIWQESIDGPPGVIEATWQRGFPQGNVMPAVGISAPETLEVHAVGPGEVTLQVSQRRHWEQDVAPQSQHTMVVHVAPAGRPDFATA